LTWWGGKRFQRVSDKSGAKRGALPPNGHTIILVSLSELGQS